MKSFAFLLILLAIGPALHAQEDEFELPPFSYSVAQPKGRVADLIRDMAHGRWAPPAGEGKVILDAFLRRLDIPRDSQTLVFSKTSEQNPLINPGNPRSLYFNDRTYVGWVPGGKMEIADIDPVLGPIFYIFDPRVKSGAKVVRDNGCLSCHASSRTDHIPGIMARSVTVDATGEIMVSSSDGSSVTDDTPFSSRWGGWYVTGTHGDERHMGNVVGPEGVRRPKLDFDKGANRVDLEGLVDTKRYVESTSDIVALMVMEHQLGVQSRVTKAQYAYGLADARYGQLMRETGGEFGGGTLAVIRNRQATEVVDGLLFKNEAPLPKGGVKGSGKFDDSFMASAKRDVKGRSLRDLDLKTRLFQYRCSYMIYTDSILALPVELKAEIYHRLWSILLDKEKSEEYAYLAEDEKAAISDILKETHLEIAKIWAAFDKGANEDDAEVLLKGADS